MNNDCDKMLVAGNSTTRDNGTMVMMMVMLLVIYLSISDR